jgi:uncharacterized repeat protein (TIGR01451 family)
MGSRRISVVLAALAAAVCAPVANAGDSRVASGPAIEIAISPKVQTLQTTVRHHKLVLGTATFRITVSNPGAVSLGGVKVTDSLSPRCSRSIGSLAAGASITFSCFRTNVGRSYTNVATVSGQPLKGVRDLTGVAAPVTATATSRVRVAVKVTSSGGVPAFTG